MNDDTNNISVIKQMEGSYGIINFIEEKNQPRIVKISKSKYSSIILKEIVFLNAMGYDIDKKDFKINCGGYAEFKMPYYGETILKHQYNMIIDNVHMDQIVEYNDTVIFQLVEHVAFISDNNWMHCDLMHPNLLWDNSTKLLKIIDTGLSYPKLEMFCCPYEIYNTWYKDPCRYHDSYLSFGIEDEIWAIGVTILMLILPFRFKSSTRSSIEFVNSFHRMNYKNIRKRIRNKSYKKYAPVLEYCFSERSYRHNILKLQQIIISIIDPTLYIFNKWRLQHIFEYEYQSPMIEVYTKSIYDSYSEDYKSLFKSIVIMHFESTIQHNIQIIYNTDGEIELLYDNSIEIGNIILLDDTIHSNVINMMTLILKYIDDNGKDLSYQRAINYLYVCIYISYGLYTNSDQFEIDSHSKDNSENSLYKYLYKKHSEPYKLIHNKKLFHKYYKYICDVLYPNYMMLPYRTNPIEQIKKLIQ